MHAGPALPGRKSLLESEGLLNRGRSNMRKLEVMHSPTFVARRASQNLTGLPTRYRRPFRLVIGALVLIGTVSVATVPAGKAAAATPFSMSTSPSLAPAFSAKVTDYAVRCTTKSTTQFSTRGNGQVTVGGVAYSSPVTLALPLVAGQEVQVTFGTASYYIRCLPNGFPKYSATVPGHPQAPGYLVDLGTYTVAFDNTGVPVWWKTGVSKPPDRDPDYSEFLNATTIAWGQSNSSYKLVGLNGVVKGTVGGASVPLDTHDLELLSNGDYLGFEQVTRDCPAVPSQCVNLSSWGRSSKATIIDDDIVELNSTGHVIWRWSTANHVNVATANTQFHANFPDVIHMNSIQYDGHGGILFSARNLDAIYRIDMATGAITWKLGGSSTPQSLKFTKSPYPTDFSGQHYARILSDGTITVQDNGTSAVPARRVRALNISVNLTAHTAKILKQITDSRTKHSACCGSAIKLPTGDWVMAWGDNDFTTELNSNGVPQLTITYPGLSSYRAELIKATIPALRTGMNAMVGALRI